MHSKAIAKFAVLAVLGLAVIFPVVAYGDDSGDSGADRQVDSLVALGTGFTFQGRLTDAGTPANGAYDLNFYLYDAPAGGNQVGPVQTVGDVSVTAGLFTVILNFGDVFHGAVYYLEVQVRPGVSAGAYTILSPREALGAVPNASYALEAGSLLVPQTNSGDSNVPLLRLINTNAVGGGSTFVAESASANGASAIAGHITSAAAGNSVGVLGTNAGTGNGVQGFSANGLGVLGSSTSGVAIRGVTTSGTGGLFTSITGDALEVQGPIKVSGSQPAAFVHVATGGSYVTVIDNPLTNGDPDAIVFATHVYDPPGSGAAIYQTRPFSVWYNGSKWTIYNDVDFAIPIAPGTAFFVLVIKR